MAGIELIKDRKAKERAGELRNKIIYDAFHKGLLLLGCGENTIHFCPALTVSEKEIDVCLSIFGDIVKEAGW